MSPARPAVTLFISYRREDTAAHAGRLYDRLSDHFGRAQVFMDIDHIEPGEDFVEAINRKVGGCDVAIVLIGPEWLSLTDAAGHRRLDDPEDFVRMEIVAALQRNIRVIPILVGGARMPRKQDLPEELAPLSRRNALEISESRFHADVDRLIDAIEKPHGSARTETAAQSELRPADEQRDRGTSANYLRTIVVSLLVIAVIATGVTWLVLARGARDAHATGIVTATGPSTAQANDSGLVPAATPSPQTSPAGARESLRAQLEKERADEWRIIEDQYQPQKWLPEIRKNAEAGLAQAQFELGIFYEFGLPNLPKDANEALQWYRKAAMQGHAVARRGMEDLSATTAPTSEEEIRELDSRRQGRLQAILAHVYRGTNGKAE